MYNPDNPKIHCDTLQLLDNYWNGADVNVPNQNKKPEEFAEECWEYLENGTNPSFLFSKIRNCLSTYL